MTDQPGVLPYREPGAPPPPEPAGGAALRDALLDSRQRWRDLVTLAADIAFETDASGRLLFVAPDPALGWPSATLLGQTGELLLADPEVGGFNPFRPEAAARRRRAWLRRPDGSTVCAAFSVVPLLDGEGRVVGARGVGQDVTEQDVREAEAAALLRRGELMDHILWRMRKEVLAPRMMHAVLESLGQATSSEGLAVLDRLGNGCEPVILHAYGRPAPSVLPVAVTLLACCAGDPATGAAYDGKLVMVCPTETRFGEEAALVLWRPAESRAWDSDERMLVSAVTAVVRVVLEHEAIQREMARQARTDPLTGLLNRRAFMEEMTRRFDRLEREELPGALLFVDLDNFKALNDARGHEAGDEALRIAAQVLRGCIRPTDLAARLGGDEFALWLDGAEEFGAAERAEQIRVMGPAALAHLSVPGAAPLTMSIGVAARWPGRGEDAETLLQRADAAMYAVKRTGRGHWHVARPEAAR